MCNFSMDMDMNKLDGMAAMYFIVGFIGVAILLYLFVGRKSNKEGFKVLGTLSPYSDLYYRCLSQCERSDPGKQLLPTKGNFMCGEYCDSVITKMARVGGPSDPKVPKIPTPEVKTYMDQAYEICGDGSKGDWCRSLFHSSAEIHEKCKQDCEYSTRPRAECMDLCSRTLSANKSITGGWSWK